MATEADLVHQVGRILDEGDDLEVEVIVQMEAGRERPKKLMQAAGEALSRRRFSLSARDLLPGPYSQRVSPQEKNETASARVLLGKAAAEAITLGKIKESGLAALHPLLQSGIARAALDRMSAASTASRRTDSSFWTSRSLALRLERGELSQLVTEVDGIRAVHPNRRLSLPPTAETRQTSREEHDLTVCTWGLETIRAPAAWGAFRARGEGVTVALLDTGVDPGHPDLVGKVAHWAEFDSLGNALVKSKAYDSGEHGTHCAGTIAGGAVSGRMIGVAPEAKIAAALVLNGAEGGTDAQILAGIDWAVERGVDVISLSLGGLVMDAETPSTYTEAILSCQEAGIPVVVAIGNEGQQTTGSPGNDLFALSVGATDPADRVAGFSGGRTQVIRSSRVIDAAHLPLLYSKPDLSAPGVAVYSAVPNGGWRSLSGTSMAAPHVAGAIALLLSATTIRQKEKGAHRALLIQDLLLGSVEELGEAGQDHRYGFGRLDVFRAIDAARKRGY